MTAGHEVSYGATGGELGALVDRHDWPATSLGPIASWPGPLRDAVALILESPHPMLVWAGPELLAVYNDPFRALAGNAHPAALGAPGSRGFAAFWPVLGPALRQVQRAGTATSVTDQPLVLARRGPTEETYWTFAHSPVRGADGAVLGVFSTVVETTERVINDRRRATLAALRRAGALRPVPGDPVDQVAGAALEVLARHRHDVPFAAFCRFDGTGSRTTAGYGLAGELPLLRASGAAESVLDRVRRTGDRVLVDGLRERFPGAFPTPPDAVGPHGPDAAVVLPLRATDGAPSDRVLVLGTNPYRPLDEVQLAFLGRIGAHLSAALFAADRAAAGTDGAAGGPPAEPGRDLHPDLSTALFEERERYRTLVTQAPVGIWVADRRGVTTFVNERVALLWERPAAQLVGAAWADGLHPEDRDRATNGWAAAVRDGGLWDSLHRVVTPGGAVREVRSSARPLRNPVGEVTGFLGTTTDVTEERRAELIRREVATEQAARRASDAAAARLRALVQGLAAIVWEARWQPDTRRLQFTFVSDRAEELLGHPVRRWQEDPDFWPSIIHPDDRAEVLAHTAARLTAGRNHDLTYRVVADDGRVRWVHQVVHVGDGPEAGSPAASGTDSGSGSGSMAGRVPAHPVTAHGVTVDVTEQKRASRAVAVLADAGQLLAHPGRAEQRLTELARMLVPDLGAAAVVSLVDPDGRLRRIADPAPAGGEEPGRTALAGDATPTGVTDTAPTGATDAAVPRAVETAVASGLPVVLPVTAELDRALGRPAGDPPGGNALLVPLALGQRLLGLLAFRNAGAPRPYHPSELDLAAEVGRRASLLLAADRQRTRERHLQQVSADLASAGSVDQAARLLVARLPDMLGASGVGVYLADPDRGIRLVHAGGAGASAFTARPVLRPDDPAPVAAAVRTGEPVWIPDPQTCAADWPQLMARPPAGQPDESAGAVLPLTAAGRVVGAIGLGFRTRRSFPDDERDFVLALVAQAAPAFERAAAADERQLVAEILQRSLLPPTLPRLDRLPLASRYLPGARGTQAGGDWYDVLPLDDGRVAVAVGDVVGQGARAAAIMGQLRSALSGYLLEGHLPAPALERLDRFAGRVPGAAGSTVACLVLDLETGELSWARAGHPPPLVTGPDGCHSLEGAAGTVLAVRGRPPFTAGAARLSPGQTIVLYTDGLVERRGELVDDGIARLADLAARHHDLTPDRMADALLTGALAGSAAHSTADGPDPTDDVALIVARLVPAPLRLALSAEAGVLRELRASLLAWASTVGVHADDIYDLQLAVGEAAANAVEHAYRDQQPGPMAVDVTHQPDGSIQARVRDEGSWRPIPGDPGFRGRGLQLIRDVSSQMQLRHGPQGTEVGFTLGPSASPAGAAPTGESPTPSDGPWHRTTAAPPVGPATIRLGDTPRTVTVSGELDLAGVRAVREQLLAAAAAGSTVTVDLRPTSYLASAGVALLAEADRTARAAGGRLRLRVAPADVVRRALALSGMDGLLELDDTTP